MNEFNAKQLNAEEQTKAVSVENASKSIYEIRRLTGFTWTSLANLLNVDERAFNSWINGSYIPNKNRKHIAKTLEVLRFIDQGLAELNSAALEERSGLTELSPFEAIRTGNYEAAKKQLSRGISRPESRQVNERKILDSGGLLPIFMHPDADGTEMIEPLPYEPAPASHKRPIRRC